MTKMNLINRQQLLSVLLFRKTVRIASAICML